MQTFQKDDSEPPIILVNKAEDKNWAKSHAVTITISDKESNLAEEIELQYAWSESKEEEPVQWNKMTSKSKTVVNSGVTGKYYLWTKTVNVKITKAKTFTIEGEQVD